MRGSFRKYLLIAVVSLFCLAMVFVGATIFFDQAVLVRNDTFFRKDISKKLVALTFDDGPSERWTPEVLGALKKAGIKGTFFMIGEHVQEFPAVARRVVMEGHDIGNHTYDHRLLLNFREDRLEKEIKDAEKAIKDTTGRVTTYFRPPKAWLTDREKKKIRNMGYTALVSGY